MSRNGTPVDPDDFFAETRMSFGDHIEDLRIHLWRAIAGFGVALVFSLFIGHLVVNFITAPVKAELRDFYERRTKKLLAEQKTDPEVEKANRPTPFFPVQGVRKQWEAFVKGKNPEINRPRIVSRKEQEARTGTSSGLSRWWESLSGDNAAEESAGGAEGPFYEIPEEDADKELLTFYFRYPQPLDPTAYVQDAQRRLLDVDNPATLNVQEAFMVWFKVCMVTGVVIGSPWIFWQIWMFVAAGLYPHEKRLVHVYLPVSLALFLCGVVICELFVIPKAISTLLWFNEWMGLKPDMRLSEWLGFAIYMPLVFGASFQTPLVMLFMARLGIVDENTFRNKRRYAWFIMAVFAAVITPSTDALSMLFLWVPMSLLFELGILMIRLSPNRPEPETDVPEPDEMVEV